MTPTAAARALRRSAVLVAALLGGAAAAAPGDLGAPGAPDPSFGSNGQRLARNILGGIGRDGVELQGLRLLPDGRLVVLAQGRCGASCRYEIVARYLAGGAPDRSFGDPAAAVEPGAVGVVEFAKGAEAGPQLQGLVVRRDGSVVVGYVERGGGLYGASGAASLHVVSRNGRRSTDRALPRAFAPEAALPGGAVVGLSGRSVVRLGPDLRIDTAFGGDGDAALPAAMTLVHGVDAAGRVLVVGGSDRRGFVLVRMSAAGRRLSVGRLSVPGWRAPGGLTGVVTQVAGRPNGGALFAAYVWARSRSGTLVQRSVVGAFGGDGRADRRFGSRGLVRLPVGEYGATLAVGRGGDVVVLSQVPSSRTVPRAGLVLRRLGADGSPDPAFPLRRIRTVARWFQGLGVGIDARGRIIAAGAAGIAVGNGGALLARFTGG